MVPALSFDELKKQIERRYDYDERRIVGIMLARYDIKPTQDMIEQCYPYWNLNTGKQFDVFWAGYGAYLCPDDESATKIILKYRGNTNSVYFDLEAFVSIKDQFNYCFKSPYEDTIQLILVNYRNGRLHFDEAIRIDLEENVDINYATIRRIMEFVANECRSAYDVKTIAEKMRRNKLHEKIKGITISDVISTALALAGLF